MAETTEKQTKVCDNCDQEIGKNETKCPKCGVVFEELEEDLKTAEAILAKRKARETPTPETPATPATPEKKRRLFASTRK